MLTLAFLTFIFLAQVLGAHTRYVTPKLVGVSVVMQVSKRDNTFGLQLELLLKAVDISQTDLATLTKVPRVSINRYIKGKTDIRSSDIIKLLSALGIDLKEVVYSHLKKISEEPKAKESIEVAQDIECIFKNLSPHERKTYLAYLVNHAKILNPQIPLQLIQRLKEAV